MNKEFIPYEQALALKELGFDEPTLYHWHKSCKTHPFTNEVYNPTCRPKTNSGIKDIGEENHAWSAPTFSQAFRWFRERYDLQHTITWNKHYPKTPYEWEVRKSWRDEPLRPYGISGMSATYEEAEQACLNKLIEIVKQSANK